MEIITAKPKYSRYFVHCSLDEVYVWAAASIYRDEVFGQ